VDGKWFAQFATHVANNVLNREGQVRFSYMQLRGSLDAVKDAREQDVDPAVADLFRNIVKAMPEIDINDKEETLLLLLLLNIQMAYGLISGYTLNSDPSISNNT